MRNIRRIWLFAALLVLLPGTWMAAQTSRPATAPAASTAPVSEEDLTATRERLFSILRLSPKLTSVLSRDPSLLSDQEYVSRNNPALAQFLQQHPDVVRNPEFFLFSDHSRPGMRLEQYVFPELGYQQSPTERIWSDIIPLLIFICLFTAVLWLLRVIMENRRWSRLLKLQSDTHGKLLDKFGNNQELLAYMNTEAGKRFLEAAPLPVSSELPTSAKMSLTRILLPLQLGVVIFLLGAAFFSLQSVPGGETAFRVLGMLGVTLGVGFIISAALAYFLARHLDLLPKKPEQLAAREQS